MFVLYFHTLRGILLPRPFALGFVNTEERLLGSEYTTH